MGLLDEPRPWQRMTPGDLYALRSRVADELQASSAAWQTERDRAGSLFGLLTAIDRRLDETAASVERRQAVAASVGSSTSDLSRTSAAPEPERPAPVLDALGRVRPTRFKSATRH